MNATGMGRDLRRLSSDITTKYLSEIGTQNSNRCYFGFIPMDGFICWAVAETHDNSEVNSATIAVQAVLNLFSQKPTLSKRRLKSYINEANRELLKQSGQYQRKASIMVVASNYKKMRYAQCGDCRLHVFRNGVLVMRSDDQSLMGQMISEGVIPDDNEQGKAESRNLLSFLGQGQRINIFASKKLELMDDDVLLMSTWGLWDRLSTLEMLDALEGAKNPESYLEELQELLLSKQEKGMVSVGHNSRILSEVENYTVAAIFANKTYMEANNTKKYIKIALMILIPVLIIGIIWGIIVYRRHVIRTGVIAEVEQFINRGDIHFADHNFNRAFIEFENAVVQSRTLTGITRRRIARNGVIQESAEARFRVAQLVLDGEDHFHAGRYDEARIHFQRAIQSARLDEEVYDLLDNNVINERIILTENHAHIRSLMLLSSIQADFGQYADALENLEEARALAVRIGNRQALDTIRLSVVDVNGRLAAEALAREQQLTSEEQRAHNENIQRIEGILLAANDAFANGDFIRGRALYEEAIREYIAAGESASATAARLRLTNMEVGHQQEQQAGIVRSIEMFIIDGDRALADGDYARAATIFEQAAWDFIMADEPTMAAALQYRIIDANARRRTDMSDRLNTEIEIAVLEADIALALGNFDRAISIFEQAARDYIESGNIALATAMRFRILDAEALREQQAVADVMTGIERIIVAANMADIRGDYDNAIYLYIAALNHLLNAEEFARAATIQGEIVRLSEALRQREQNLQIGVIESNIIDGQIAASFGNFFLAFQILEEAAIDLIALGEPERATEVRNMILDIQQGRQAISDAHIIDQARRLETQGDSAFSIGAFNQAISFFNQARSIFQSLDMTNDVARINGKIQNVNDNVANRTVAAQVSEANSLETEGNRLLALNNFAGARDMFRRAQDIFQRHEMASDVTRIQGLITRTNELEAEMRQREDEAERGRVTFQAESLLQLGMLSLLDAEGQSAAGNYAEALAFLQLALTQFTESRALFLQIGSFDRAVAVQDHINQTSREITLLP